MLLLARARLVLARARLVLARARLVLALGAPALATTACWTGSAAEPGSPAQASEATSGDAAPPSPRPVRATACLITVAPPVAATSLGTLQLVLPDGEALAHVVIQWTADDGSTGTSIQLGNALASTLTVRPGIYAAAIETQTGARVRCAGIPIAAGGATTVTVTRLAR